MITLRDLRDLDRSQWSSFLAAYMAWTLDAFDFFLFVMVAGQISSDFHTSVSTTSYGIFLTLATRPLGALLFGRIADHWGRRPALIGSILVYTVVELLSGFAPSLTILFVLRAAFGIGMGGVWGVGASLAMESVPPKSRGLLSGILQQGYPLGYLLAAVTYGLLYPVIGWRGLFVVGALPCLVVIFIHQRVAESPGWKGPARGSSIMEGASLYQALRAEWRLFVYMVVLMTAFTCFSHGTQDLYPSGFLEHQRGLPIADVTRIVVALNLGAIVGGILFGACSQRFGRRRTIAGAALMAVPMIPLWVGGTSVLGLGLGSFLMQFAVQGAWGVVPAHLNELSPKAVRGTFPGLAYQLGNLISSGLAPIQAHIAETHAGDYGLSLGVVTAAVAGSLAILAIVGPERSAEKLV